MANNRLTGRVRLAAAVAIFFHLTVIGIHNTWASLEGWCRIREATDVPAMVTAVREALQQAALSPLIHGYARLTGLNTGYTFFAPQVGSFYHYEVACLAPDGSDVRVVSRPPLSGAQGYLRYQNFLELFHVFHADDPAENADRRYARAVAKSVARHLLPAPCSHYRIQVGVYTPQQTVYTLYADTLTAKPLP